MLITVSGAQGCGKSTILEQIEQLGYPVVQRKTSRSILTEWNKTLDEINDDPVLSKAFQDEILTRKMEDEGIAVADNSVHFTERTYMDLFVYALINLGKFNEHTKWLNAYYYRCLEAQSSYSQVFYVKSGLFQVTHDGVRGSNEHYSRMVDLVLEDYTTNSIDPLKLVMVTQSSVADRIALIQSHIG